MNKNISLLLIAGAVVMGLAASTLFTAAPTITAASSDYFLQIDGVKGESSAKGHEGTIEVDSWSFGATNTAVNTGGGGLGSGVGKVSRNGLTITKRIDKASPLLYSAATSGKHMKDATLSFSSSNGSRVTTIHMSDVIISSYSLSGSGGDNPTETISFNYTKIEVKY